jgi:hypothetical protein
LDEIHEIQTKGLRVFLLAIHSHLYCTALPSDFFFFKLTQPLTCLFKLTQPVTASTVQLLYTVKERKPDRKPDLFPYGLKIHTETSSLRNLKMMPRNLKEIILS